MRTPTPRFGETTAWQKILASIARDPYDPMHVGADLGSQVIGKGKSGGFVGLIELVRIYSGECTAQEIQKDAEETE